MDNPKARQKQALVNELNERFPKGTADRPFFVAYVAAYIADLDSPSGSKRIFVDGQLHGEPLSPEQLAAMAMADAQRVSARDTRPRRRSASAPRARRRRAPLRLRTAARSTPHRST